MRGNEVLSIVGWSLNGKTWDVDKCSWVKWSEGLSNRVSIITRRCIDDMKFAACMAVSFITFLHILLVLFYIIVCMVVCFVGFCLISYITYSYYYSFLLLCVCILNVICVPFWVFCFIVLFYVLPVCKCVLYYCHRVSAHLQLTNISFPHAALIDLSYNGDCSCCLWGVNWICSCRFQRFVCYWGDVLNFYWDYIC
jgi:hypothetical protein